MKFKVGDRVKSKFGFGTVKEIKEKNSIPILVYHENWSAGHNAEYSSEQEYTGNHCWRFNEDELELVEPIKQTEIKINGVNITAGPFKITRDDLLAKNTINLEEQYKRYVLGKWDKENSTIRKEGNKMIESIQLIDLYASKHKENIEKEAKEKVEELKKNCDVINRFNELTEQFKKDCDELYLSQFTDDEKEDIILNHEIDDSNMQLRRNRGLLYNYEINEDFKSDEYYDVMNERNKELAGIDDLVKTVKAHIGIAKTKDEVEEILTRYGIIDKKGKLVV